jgi:hypothetical protein
MVAFDAGTVPRALVDNHYSPGRIALISLSRQISEILSRNCHKRNGKSHFNERSWWWKKEQRQHSVIPLSQGRIEAKSHADEASMIANLSWSSGVLTWHWVLCISWTAIRSEESGMTVHILHNPFPNRAKDRLRKMPWPKRAVTKSRTSNQNWECAIQWVLSITFLRPQVPLILNLPEHSMSHSSRWVSPIGTEAIRKEVSMTLITSSPCQIKTNRSHRRCNFSHYFWCFLEIYVARCRTLTPFCQELGSFKVTLWWSTSISSKETEYISHMGELHSISVIFWKMRIEICKLCASQKQRSPRKNREKLSERASKANEWKGLRSFSFLSQLKDRWNDYMDNRRPIDIFLKITITSALKNHKMIEKFSASSQKSFPSKFQLN